MNLSSEFLTKHSAKLWGPTSVWTQDPFACNPNKSVIVGTRTCKSNPPVDQLVIVLDDSASMAPHIDTLRSQLQDLPTDRPALPHRL